MMFSYIKPLRKLYGEDNVIFHDTWHLNENGQKIYADYAKVYDWIN